MAVDWLSPTVIMNGCTEGGVWLWDLRSGGKSCESRIQHPNRINHVRRIDENMIVVAGLESPVSIPFTKAGCFRIKWPLKLCTYDLRFPSYLATPGQATRPYFQFPSYQNLHLGHLSAGFDVHGEVVAAVTGSNDILIYDVKRSLRLVKVKAEKGTPTGSTTCVRFENGEKDVQALRLMAATGSRVTQVSWWK